MLLVFVMGTACAPPPGSRQGPDARLSARPFRVTSADWCATVRTTLPWKWAWPTADSRTFSDRRPAKTCGRTLPEQDASGPLSAVDERRAPRRQLEEMPTPWASPGHWHHAAIGFKALSLDQSVLDAIAPESVDFIYLDGAHDTRTSPGSSSRTNEAAAGGMLAGHDYCKYDERPLPCRGCETNTGVREIHRARSSTRWRRHVAKQWGVVRAVQEWPRARARGLPRSRISRGRRSRGRHGLRPRDHEYLRLSWYVFKPKRLAPMAKNARCDSTSRTAGAQSCSAAASPFRRAGRTHRYVRARLSYSRTTLGISGGNITLRNRRRNSRAPTIDSSPTSWTRRGSWLDLFKVSADDACCASVGD